MSAMKLAAVLLKGSRRLLGGLTAAVLLMPLPAMAITYLGSWTAAYSTTGSPTPPKATFTDLGVVGDNDTLTVDSGNYTPSNATTTASSTITLKRQVSLSANQTIEFDHSFDGLFSQAGYSASVAVQDSSGKTVVTPFSVNKSTTSKTFTELQDSLNVLKTLGKGNYTLVVTVTTSTNNKLGGWQKKAKSGHEFDFQGQ